MDPAGDGAEFHIPTVGRQQGGSYSCSYRPPSEPFVSSQPSHPVQLVVADPTQPGVAPAPTHPGCSRPGTGARWGITIKPALEGSCCPRNRPRGLRLVGRDGGRDFWPEDSDGSGAVFPISNVHQENGGSYSCSYHSRSEPFAVSSPSNPVQLVVRGAGLGSASPFPAPSPARPSQGLDLPDGNLRPLLLVLSSAPTENSSAPSSLEPPFRELKAAIKSPLTLLFCSWRPGLGGCPGLALTACLLCADPSLPRPSISLSPTGVTTPGANVTIRCQGQRRDVRFFLHKPGDLNPPGHRDPAGDGAEFHIPTVGRQDGGSYSCSYRPPSEPFVSSDPSDPVELVVAEPSYPKPSISLSPSGGVSLGEAVSVWCRGQHRDMRFVLNEEGRHFPPVDPKGFEAVFPISNVSREHGGSYSCSYHSRSKPSAASSPSDPVELVVRDPSLPRPSISLSPTGVTTPGADVTIRCQGQRRDVRFFLHKAGDLNPPRDMDPAGDGAEFHIPTVGRQHGGNYSCSYRPPSEPFVSSDPSDPVELVVAAAPAGRQDFTYANIARLALSAMVLLVLGLILAEAYYSRPREVP
ncbi:unnamed protein product [Natator depressus]